VLLLTVPDQMTVIIPLLYREQALQTKVLVNSISPFPLRTSDSRMYRV
jgi:hypothetical protein